MRNVRQRYQDTGQASVTADVRPGGRLHMPTAAERAFAQAQARRPVLIAVPLYRHPELADAVIRSLIASAADIVQIAGEVVIYNDSPQDQALARALEALLPSAEGAFRCRLERNEKNLGFVGTANRALEEAAARGMDAVLLNSDTVVFPGALAEMARVARLDPMIGFVNPRSNNATLATLPYQERFRHLPPDKAYQAWGEVAPRLPEMSYVPTGVGFCLWIKWAILAEFGVFDEIYGAGYNEENDLIMRAGRRGYRTVLANHAFVWHQGAASFGLQDKSVIRELNNRAMLQARYPEYWRLTQQYFDSPEQRAEHLLGALIPGEDGRLQVAFDFSSFVAAHNGTFAAGLQLLEAAARAWADRFEIFVLCAEETFAFHDYARFAVQRRDPHDSRPFAAIFRVGQPYEWGAVERLVLKAPVIGVFMLDTISQDCSQLAESKIANLWAYTLEHADFIAATSELTASQLERRFAFGRDTARVRSLHSLDIADYRLPDAPPEAAPAPPGYFFVIGNHYWHKDVANAANALAAAYPERSVVVLAGREEVAARREAPVADGGRYAPRGLAIRSNIIRVPAGELTPEQMSALYTNAAAVVFPSHYEGFGIPVMNALAAQTPVFVRPLQVFEEMSRVLGGEANLHVFATTTELVAALADPPPWTAEGASQGRPGDAERTAVDIGAAIDQAIGRVDYARIVRRVRALQTAHDLAGVLRPAPAQAQAATPALFVAHRIGLACERAATWALQLPGVYPALRAIARAALSLTGGRRSRAA